MRCTPDGVVFRVAALAILGATLVTAQPARRPWIFGGQTLLHAHNAYPEERQWADRLDRAIATGLMPIVIEQDIAFDPSRGTVVSHDTTLDGSEPSLSQHFFDRIAPVMERAVKAGARDRWPVVVLHLDFKSNERPHHRAVWDLLVKHRGWLTTAAAVDSAAVSPFNLGPLLVLTENGADQEQDFSEWARSDGAHLLFGTIPGPVLRQSDDPKERATILRTATPNQLIPAAATSYRRWANFSWGVVEEGGPAAAGDWTKGDAARLAAIVDRAHAQGLLIRFYTLNGHDAKSNRGWTASYNFGSLNAVQSRWQAAVRAGVDLIATDQYEELAALLARNP